MEIWNGGSPKVAGAARCAGIPYTVRVSIFGNLAFVSSGGVELGVYIYKLVEWAKRYLDSNGAIWDFSYT